MFRIQQRHRIWIFLFALWFMFEPLVVTYVKAGEAPERPQKKAAGASDLEAALNDAADPEKVVKDLLELQGHVGDDMSSNKVKGALEGKAYADFLFMVSSAYDLMDDDAADAITFPDVAEKINTFSTIPLQVEQANQVIQKFAKFNTLEKIDTWTGKMGKKLFMFFSKSAKSSAKNSWKRKLLVGMKNTTGTLKKYVGKTFDIMVNIEPPDNIKDTRKLFSFFKKGAPKELSKAQATGQCIGIGLSVLSLAASSYKLATSEDTKGENYFSYENVKTGIDVLLAAAGLIAMFCAFPVGTIIAIISMVVLVVSMVLDKFGEYNKKWREGYGRDFNFLEEKDPEFPAFLKRCEIAENAPGGLRKALRSAAWIMADRKKAEWDKQGVNPERVKWLYKSLSDQGKLVNYYQKRSLQLPSNLDLPTLMELWKTKASFMALKPTAKEKEEEANKSGFSKFLGYCKVWEWPSNAADYVADTVANRKMAKEAKNYPPAYFNASFFLCKRFQNFLISSKNRRGSIYDVVGLRIEQAPYNYIWLVGLDSKQWTEDCMISALEGDIFFCGTKEIKYMSQVMEKLIEKLKEQEKGTDKSLEDVQDFYDEVVKINTEFDKLADAYSSEKSSGNTAYDWEPKGILNTQPEFGDIWKPCAKISNGVWKKDEVFNAEPKNIQMNAGKILKRYKADIEQRLAIMPQSINKKIIQLFQLQIMFKGINDRCSLLKKLGDERKECLADFDKDFPDGAEGYPALRNYLANNTFLGVGGSWQSVNDWFSGILPAKGEMEKFNTIYMKEVDKYEKIGKDMQDGETSSWLIFTKKLPNPAEMIGKLKEERAKTEELITKFKHLDDAPIRIWASLEQPAIYKFDPPEIKITGLNADDEFAADGVHE